MLSTGPNFTTSSGSGMFFFSGTSKEKEKAGLSLFSWLGNHLNSPSHTFTVQLVGTDTDASMMKTGTSEKHIQHGDVDVFGAFLFVLHQLAKLLRSLDDALLSVFRRQQLHGWPARHH